MSEPVKITIPCDVCRDLAPLVQDNAASAGSVALVKTHLAACGECRALFPDILGDTGSGAEGAPPPPPEPDDARILHNIRQRLDMTMLGFMFTGALLGSMALASSRYSVFILLIFPLVAGFACWRGNRQWRLVPLLACVMDFVPTCLRLWRAAQGPWRPVKAVIHTVRLQWPTWLLLAVLCLAGALAAKLFKFAVKGEKYHEKTDH